jgi:hypothetical protein
MATGEHWGYQRCGRYAYQRVLMHSTNPDHLVPSPPSLTDIPPLRAADGYAGGRPHRLWRSTRSCDRVDDWL